MKVHVARFTLLLSILALTACMVPAAGAQMAAFDHTYGVKNRVALPTIPGYTGAVASTCRVVDGKLLISGEFGYRSATKRSLAVTAISAGKHPAMSGGAAVARWKLQHIPSGKRVVAQEFAPDGSFAYAAQRVPTSRKVDVYRVRANGKRDRPFGENGVVKFDLAKAYDVRVLPSGDGPVLVIFDTDVQTTIVRLRASGKVDRDWGDNGYVNFNGPRNSGPESPGRSATLLAGGGLLIARRSESTTRGPDLVRLTPSGQLDTAFAGGGSWSPPLPTGGGSYSRTGHVMRTLALRNGKYLVAYVDFAPENESSGYFRQALVDPATGTVVALRTNAGIYHFGGDGGDPDDYPWRIVERNGGPVFGHAQTFFDHAGGTFLGEAWGFGAPFTAVGQHVRLGTNVTSISDFAGSPRFERAFACGAEGKTPSQGGHPAERGIRKQIAIRQLAL